MLARMLSIMLISLYSVIALADFGTPDIPGDTNPGSGIGVVPAQNVALYLGKGSHVTTGLDMSSFFSRDFTITAWVMPQYPTAHLGPIFSNTDEGVFIVGQGDYRRGNVKFASDKIYEGAPVFYIQVGNQKAFYLAPDWQANEWVHVAVRFLNGKFALFVNGHHLTPKIFDSNGNIINASAPEIAITEKVYPNQPKGKLRFGSISPVATSHALTKQKNAAVGHSGKYDIYDGQLYGLLDDIGVFDKGFSDSKLLLLKSSAFRLNGYEEDLLAGWGFEQPSASGQPLPPKLAGTWSAKKTFSLNVSSNRNDSDAVHFDNWWVITNTAPSAQLPFSSGEIWRVNQGYDNPAGSHNGYAAFSYDLALYDGGNALGTVRTVASGKVLCYRNDHDPTANEKREGNTLHQRTSSGDYVLYLHLETGYPDYSGGVPTEAVSGYCFAPGDEPYLTNHAFVGVYGDKAEHLHFSAGSQPTYGPTQPYAFGPYYASDDNGVNWYKVLKGIPKQGQLIYW